MWQSPQTPQTEIGSVSRGFGEMMILPLIGFAFLMMVSSEVESLLHSHLRVPSFTQPRLGTTFRTNIAPALQVKSEMTYKHMPFIAEKQDQPSRSRLHKLSSIPGEYKKKVDNFFHTQVPMLKYLWPHDSPKLKFYLVASLCFMVLGKWFNTKVPFILQRAIDGIPGTVQGSSALQTSGISVGLAILAYGMARAAAVFCEELKTCLFTNVSQSVLRKFAYQIFTHLHTLGTDFHLQTPSGVISVAYVRAVRGFQQLMFQLIFSVLPVTLELGMVANILYRKFSPTFAAITLTTFASYIMFTVFITQWRVLLRKRIVEVDNTRNGFFIDSLLNQEVVKLFNNEKQEIKRFDGYLARMERLNIQSTYAVALLNLGQAVLFCAGLTTSLLVGLKKVQRGEMSVGDLVAVNSMLLQLAIPFDFIGYTYQELRQSLVDMGYMNQVLNEHQPTAPDRVGTVRLEDVAVLGTGSSVASSVAVETSDSATHGLAHTISHGVDNSVNLVQDTTVSVVDAINAASPAAISGSDVSTTATLVKASIRFPPSTVEFRNVTFSYRKSKTEARNAATITTSTEDDTSINSSERSIMNDYSVWYGESEHVLLDNISFSIAAGENVAIVGPSGSGKSTTLKLITRMLEVDSGSILVDGVDISNVTKESVRSRVAVVPQDNCLFDDTVEYNIRYGSADASEAEVQEAVQQSNLVDTLTKLPQGLNTHVGERGARLSGGERQKVSIARALLRKPSLLLCDEVTSSVDALAEREIIDTLRKCSGKHLSGSNSKKDQGHGEGVGERQETGPMRTTITVAHRLSSVAHCDKILVLQKGRVVEQGTHHELMQLVDGVYRNMWNIQNHVVNEKNSVDGTYIE